jgi:hypothetical protein
MSSTSLSSLVGDFPARIFFPLGFFFWLSPNLITSNLLISLVHLRNLDHLDAVANALHHLDHVDRVKATFLQHPGKILLSVEGTEELL